MTFFSQGNEVHFTMQGREVANQKTVGGAEEGKKLWVKVQITMGTKLFCSCRLNMCLHFSRGLGQQGALNHTKATGESPFRVTLNIFEVHKSISPLRPPSCYLPAKKENVDIDKVIKCDSLCKSLLLRLLQSRGRECK